MKRGASRSERIASDSTKTDAIASVFFSAFIMGCGASRPTANKYADTSSEAVSGEAFRSPVGKENTPPRRTKDNEETREPGESLDTCEPEALAAAAALAIRVQGAQRDADALTLEAVLRDPQMARSLRRHASLCGLASGGARGASDAESTFLVASKLFDLHAALAASDGGAAFIAASDLKAFANFGAVGLSPIAADAAPVAVAAALSGSAAPFHEKLTPALEAMRAEIFCAAAGALIELEKGARKKRVVVLGGGFCGAIVAHELTRGDSQGIDTEEFAVTLVDTKEFFEFTPSVLRLMADEKAEEKGMWKKSAIEFEKIMGGKGELIIGSAAAVRRDHVLLGTAAGVASRMVPFDYLVICTGSSYQSNIKTEGTSIEARKRSFALERERIKTAPAINVVGSGLVATELAFDLKAFFPEKPIEMITRSLGLLPRIPGANERVAPLASTHGIKINLGAEVMHVDEQGRASTRSGDAKGLPNARSFWATGYQPNSAFLADARTESIISGMLDSAGYVRTKETCQLDHADLGHIFAGGDICHAGAFTVGERTMNAAIKHGFTIVKNLLKLVGMREGKMKKPLAHFTPGSEFLAVSLGNTNGLLYATDPNTASLFSTKAALEAERGPLKDAGIKGWMELNPAVDYIKFLMIPSAVYNYLVNNDYTSMDQFYGKEQAYLTIDVV
jgi:NADH dehydrogenase FAD-containing subunit